MSASGNGPSRADVVEQLEGLVAGSITREAASDWACTWIERDDIRPRELDVWEAVKSLAAADLPSPDRAYLYSKDDFASWLNELNGRGS